MATQHRFEALDSLRGICACAVALAHLRTDSLLERVPQLQSGHPYVDFFFVLSGFVIYRNYGERIATGYPIASFMWLRFWRLYPLHLFMLVLFIGVEALQLVVPIGSSAPFTGPGSGVEGVLRNLLLLQAIGANGLGFNWPSWSISVEFYTYIVFAVAMAFGGRSIVLLVGFASGLALMVLRADLFAMEDFGLLRGLMGFAFGVLASALFDRVSHLDLSRYEIPVTVVLLVYLGWFAHGLASFLAPILFCGAVTLFAVQSGPVSRFLMKRPLMTVGTLSYSIYMTHIFIAGKVFVMPVVLLGRYGIKLTDDHGLGVGIISGTAIDVLYLGVVIGVSYVTYRFIELPWRAWGRRNLNMVSRPAKAS